LMKKTQDCPSWGPYAIRARPHRYVAGRETNRASEASTSPSGELRDG
jgi:hypothetical protein